MKHIKTFENFAEHPAILEAAGSAAYSELANIVQKQQGKNPLDCAIALTNHLMQTMDFVKMNRKESDDIISFLQDALKKLNAEAK
jgi:hypothetical protein